MGASLLALAKYIYILRLRYFFSFLRLLSAEAEVGEGAL